MLDDSSLKFNFSALTDAMRDIFNENFNTAIAPYVKTLRKEIRDNRKSAVEDIREMVIPALEKVGRELRQIRAAQKSSD